MRRHVKGVEQVTVRFVLECFSTMWNPLYIRAKGLIERKFIKFYKYLKFHIVYSINYYNSLLMYFGFSAVKVSHQFFGMCFLFKGLNNLIYSNETLNMFNLHVAAYTVIDAPLLFASF